MSRPAATGSRWSIQHIFNANDKDTNLGYGKGWRINYHQTVIQEDIGGTIYQVYTDGDGTKHYFKQVDGEWKDEMGTYFRDDHRYRECYSEVCHYR